MPRPPMPARDHVSAATRAIFDLLCDEQLHTKEEVLAAGIAAMFANDFDAALAEGRRVRKNDNVGVRKAALSGARRKARNYLMIAVRGKRVLQFKGGEQYRMPVALARYWAAEKADAEVRRPLEPVTVQQYGQSTFYAGVPEWEGWAYAPLHEKDFAHVRLIHTIPLKTVREAFPGWGVSESPEGLLTVAVDPGIPVKEVVQEWLAENNLTHEGVRIASGVRRRDLNQLPPDFLHDLIVKSLPLAHSVVAKKHRASMDVLAGFGGDSTGWVNLWVVELATTFDATMGSPFGTWVRSQMRNKVQDLNRATNGRTASDMERKFARIQEELESETGRTPSGLQIAERMNLSPNEMEAKRAVLGQFRAIRSAGTLDTSPDAPDLPVSDESIDVEREAILREQSQRITLALLSAAGDYDPYTGQHILDHPLGFLATYLMEWDDWVKSDLTYLAGCASSRMTRELDIVRDRLKKELADLNTRDATNANT